MDRDARYRRDERWRTNLHNDKNKDSDRSRQGIGVYHCQKNMDDLGGINLRLVEFKVLL